MGISLPDTVKHSIVMQSTNQTVLQRFFFKRNFSLLSTGFNTYASLLLTISWKMIMKSQFNGK
ncbi:Putative protein [Zobellia galactanivorans]|uniref:Uncharacterized protein n=1 Tax=Zobellia galactanivorans (strain DSM 12802 / CCUG 47099 / CIP 106680 / NCIMB 13871 / Dsij) TaxID=63186 RepID=G0KZG5_ZOBGA|nr:hypothetical protein B4Q04_09420 [Zobellia sp. OII3]CAZ98455.1 Putative protein [Zobellia galactanivorans]